MKLAEVPTSTKAKIKNEFRDYGSSTIDAIEVDEEDFDVVAVRHRCTKEGCNCVGFWWEKIARPLGPTVIIFK